MVEGFLCYARSLDITVLISISAITSEQTITIEKTKSRGKQLLDYIATNISEVVLFHACDMILKIH